MMLGRRRDRVPDVIRPDKKWFNCPWMWWTLISGPGSGTRVLLPITNLKLFRRRLVSGYYILHMIQAGLSCDPWHDTSSTSCYKIGNNPAPRSERLWLMAVVCVVWPGVPGGSGDLVRGHRGGVQRVTCGVMRWVTRNCTEWDNKGLCQSVVSPLPWWAGAGWRDWGWSPLRGEGGRVTRGWAVTTETGGTGGKAVNTGPGAWPEAGGTFGGWRGAGRGAGPIYGRSWRAEWSGKWGNNAPSDPTLLCGAGRKKEGSS